MAPVSWFKTIGGYAFSFMLPILAGYIAMSIADRPGLIVGMVGGYIATLGCTFADPAGKSTIPAGFLGALLAGFVGGYLMLWLKKVCDKLPNALEGIKPVLIYPLAGVLMIALFMKTRNYSSSSSHSSSYSIASRYSSNASPTSSNSSSDAMFSRSGSAPSSCSM